MIVPMKKVSVIVQTHNKRSMLRSLRKAGVMHIFDQGVRSERNENLKKQYDSLYMVNSAIADLQDKKKPLPQKIVSDEVFLELHDSFSEMLDLKKHLEEEIAKDTSAIEALKPWGDFNPKDIEDLEREGVKLYFYTLGKKDLALLDSSIDYIQLDPIGTMQAIAVIGHSLDSSISATRFYMPEFGLSALQNRKKQDSERLGEIERTLAEGGMYLDAYSLHLKKNEQDRRFETVEASMEGGEDLSWVSGYIPETEVSTFSQLASKEGWGYLLDDPSEEDEPPTLVKYPKGVGIVKPVFDILGTVPDHRENDISL